MLSSDLDELVIWQYIAQIQHEAPRYGVNTDKLINGTLVSAWPTADHGGRAGAGRRLQAGGGEEGRRLEFGDQDFGVPLPTPTPGAKRAWRIYDQRNKATADLLTLE